MSATGLGRIIFFGAVGFCIGWAVTGLLSTAFTSIIASLFPPQLTLPGLVERLPYLSWYFAGACGGAILGLGLAIKGIRPGRLVAPLILLLVAMGFSHLLYPCSPDERAVLIAFPQHGGKEVTEANEGLHSGPNPPIEWIRWFVGPHPVGGWGCGVSYYAPTGTREERIAYYRQQLDKDGWEVGPVRSERSVWGVCCQSFYAYRDGYRYGVYADSPRRRGPALEGHLLVEVTRIGVPRPGWLALVLDSG